jgi:hypothetical protein
LDAHYEDGDAEENGPSPEPSLELISMSGVSSSIEPGSIAYRGTGKDFAISRGAILE